MLTKSTSSMRAATALVALVVITANAQATARIDIPAQPLAGAIQDVARQTNTNILVDPKLVAGREAPAVQADLTAGQALSRLLVGTDLVPKYVDEKTIVLSSSAAAGSFSSEETVSPRATGDEPEAGRSFWDQFRVAQVDQGKAASDNTSVDQGEARSGLQEVIVTAQKRSEKLSDVPSSLTALSADSLQNLGVVNFSDYMTLVPSLADFSGGAEGHGAVILRGLNTGFYQTSNTVGYYIDDIPFSATSSRSAGTLLTLDPDLSDIDHLEVLKGPQATLYGASTLGGLIKVVTRKPDLTSNAGEVRVDGSSVDGGGNGYGLVGIANVVLIADQLALRVSGFDRENPGYMRNLTLDTRDRGLSRKQGGRISLRWSPAQNLEIEVSAMLQSLAVHGWDSEHVDLHTLAPVTGPYTYSLSYDPTFHTTYEVYNVDVNYTTESVGTVTNSTSYAKYHDREVIDYSPYFAFFNYFAAPGPVPADAAQIQSFAPSLAKFTDELRITSRRFGALEGLVGLFYTREQIGYSDNIYNAIPPGVQPIPDPVGNIFDLEAPSSYQEKAVFADLTYYFADTIDFTFGGRYSHNRQAATSCNSGFVSPFLGCIYTASSDNNFTYLAALRWQPAPGLNTYARVATSYRPGAAQFSPLPGYPATFKPDSLINYEVGLKGDWLDHKLNANLALYDMVWKDVQMPYNVGGFPVTSNGGRVTVKGVELEARFAPIAHLEVGVNVAYTRAKLDSVSADVSATGAVAGDTLPYTPTWAASAVVDYVQPLGGTLVSTYGLTYRYQGSKWSDYPGDLINTGVVIPHYDTVDLRAGLNWSRYQLQARVSNLFSAHGLDSLVDYRLAGEEVVGNPPATAVIIQPRAYTLSLSATF